MEGNHLETAIHGIWDAEIGIKSGLPRLIDDNPVDFVDILGRPGFSE